MVQIFQTFGISLFLWGMAISGLFIGGIFYFIRGKEIDESNERLIMYGFAGLLFCLVISRIFFLLTLTLNDSLFYIEGGLVVSNDPFAYVFYLTLEKLEKIFSIIGIILLIYPIEKKINKTKYLLTILNLFFITLITMSTQEGIVYTYGFIQSFDILVVYIILIRLIKYAEADFKSIVSLLLIGFMLIISGLLLHGAFLLNISQDFYILPPVIVILGSLISLTPVTINPKIHSNIHRLWLLFGCIPIALGVFIVLILVINIESMTITLIINILIIVIFLIFAFYQIIKLINTQQESTSKVPLNILDMFTKPPSLSTEDILLNKEKQHCLVCKNQILGYTYICPDCKALYCPKCSNSLTDLENSCWVCGIPIDKTKPVRKLQDSERKVDSKKGSAKTVKFYSDKKMLKHIFDDNLSLEEERKLGIIKLTIISDDEIDEIESLGLDDKDQEEFIKEMVHFPQAERKLIYEDISDKLNKEVEQN